MNFLEKIYQEKLIEIRNKKKLVSAQEICQQIKCSEHKPKNFALALQNKIAQTGMAIIAEVKKASPSKGVIRQDFNPVDIAKTYQENGAACLSVLTEPKYFLGQDQYLSIIRKEIDLPILRKDFIIDHYQIWESKLIGADCILLIMAMLDESKALNLEKTAHEIGLGVLAEVHNEKELEQALKLKTRMIGINNRNLKTMTIDLKTSEDLATMIPNDYLIISESGINNHLDIIRMQKHQINAFLIGESLMRKSDIGDALRKLQGKN